jgi:hypothetical protein
MKTTCALTDSADISTITIENMPGGTPWGQAQLRIFDRKFLPVLSFLVEKTTFRGVFINNSVLNLHFMKVRTEIDNNFGYEKITQLVDNIPLNEVYMYAQSN